MLPNLYIHYFPHVLFSHVLMNECALCHFRKLALLFQKRCEGERGDTGYNDLLEIWKTLRCFVAQLMSESTCLVNQLKVKSSKIWTCLKQAIAKASFHQAITKACFHRIKWLFTILSLRVHRLFNKLQK